MHMHMQVETSVDEDWVTAERVVAVRPAGWARGMGAARAPRQYLVKWRGLEYGDATWEDEGDLNDADLVGEGGEEDVCRPCRVGRVAGKSALVHGSPPPPFLISLSCLASLQVPS